MSPIEMGSKIWIKKVSPVIKKTNTHNNLHSSNTFFIVNYDRQQLSGGIASRLKVGQEGHLDVGGRHALGRHRHDVVHLQLHDLPSREASKRSEQS